MIEECAFRGPLNPRDLCVKCAFQVCLLCNTILLKTFPRSDILILMMEDHLNSVVQASLYVWASGFCVEFSPTSALLSKNNAAFPLGAAALKETHWHACFCCDENCMREGMSDTLHLQGPDLRK